MSPEGKSLVEVEGVLHTMYFMWERGFLFWYDGTLPTNNAKGAGEVFPFIEGPWSTSEE